MSAIRSIVVLVVVCLFVCLCQAQTLTYSAGWVNGKRAPPPTWTDLMVGPGHHGDPHLYPGNGPVPISDTQMGRNYLCFVVNSQLTDTLINFGLKSGSQRSVQRGQGE